MKPKHLLSAFFVCCALTAAAQEQMLENFETGRAGFATNSGEMGNFTQEVVSNPGKSELNPSDYALKFERTVANMPNWGGYWFDVKPELQSVISPQNNRYAHVKYYRTDSRSAMRLKVENSTAGGTLVEVSSMNAPEKVGEWEDLVFDLGAGVGPYSRIVFMPDFVENRPAGVVVYVDDICFSNDAAPYEIFSEAAPVGLAYSELTATSVLLSWDALKDAVSYEVYGKGAEPEKTASAEIRLSELNPDTEYVFTVRGVDRSGKLSGKSEELTVRTLPVGKLEQVTGLVNMDKIKIPADDSSHSWGWKYEERKFQDKVCLEWNPVFNATSYEIWKDGEKIGETAETKYDATGLSPHTVYCFQVKAVGENAESELTPKLYAQTEETAEQRDERMKWWRDARFGMMITWGVHSAFAGEYHGKRADKHNGQGNYSEWIMFGQNIPVEEYKEKAAEFTCENYDPDAWMKAAADAGMKYLVLISKHHDGFALWDSEASDWNAAKASGAKRDVMKPLLEAARKYGLKIGIYYSHSLDWVNKGGLGWMPQLNNAQYNGYWDAESQDKYVREVCVPQIKELMSNFGDVDIFWWDMGVADLSLEYEQLMLGAIYESKNADRIILNNRLRFDGSTPGDHDTPEQSIPGVPATGYADGHDWETCMTMNDNWGYSKHDDAWKTPEDVIRKLVDIVSKGGNFLLNVGPKADGSFPQQSSDILKELQGYMAVNGEAIHGTSVCPLPGGVPFGRVTSKKADGETTLYFHVFDWPSDSRLTVKGLFNTPESAILLADGSALSCEMSDEGLVIGVPAENPSAYSTTVKVVIKGDLDIRDVPVVQDENGELELTAETAVLADGSGICKEEKDGIVNLGCWQGVPDSGETVKWNVKINAPGTFAVEGELAAYESGRFLLRSGNGNESQIAFSGTGGWDAEYFETQRMGAFALESAGLQELELVPVAEGWHPLALRRIRLVPVSSSADMTEKEHTVRVSVSGNDILCMADCPAVVKLYNAEGRLLGEHDAGEAETVSMVCREKGMYIVRIETSDKLYIRKVLV